MLDVGRVRYVRFFFDRSNYENQRLKSKMSDVFVIVWDQNKTFGVKKHK